MTPALETRGLCKKFGGVTATDHLSLSVIAGEVHAIIGPNGAGKTTLISQLAGMVQPDAGTMHLNGRDITQMPAYKRARLGMVRSFQITSLIMDMSVADNVALAAQAHDGHSFRFIRRARTITHLRRAAFDALNEVGLAERADLPAHILSHGEHRQLEIAIALASHGTLLVLDEPMAGMGVDESRKMLTILQALKGDKTILLVEHDMDAVFALADRVTVLVYGRAIATGTPDEIRADKKVRLAYLGEA